MTRRNPLLALVLISTAWIATLWPTILYAQDAFTTSGAELFNVDLDTGNAVPVGPYGIGDVYELAMAPDGALYGYLNSQEALASVDPASGAATAIGPLGLSPFSELEDLTFDPCGQLWAVVTTYWEVPGAVDPALFTVDRDTGQTVYVGSLPWIVRSLAFVGGTLYGLADLSSSWWLVTIDTNDPSASRRLFDVGDPAIELESDPASRLWLLKEVPIADPPFFTFLDQLDPATGNSQFITELDGVFADLVVGPPAGSCGTDPLPIPTLSAASLAALALALAAAALALVRRRP